jgi:uncharacterized protein (TIGR02145 family)
MHFEREIAKNALTWKTTNPIRYFFLNIPVMKQFLKIIVFAFLTICLIAIMQSCTRKTLPVVTTGNISGLTESSAVSGGNVTNNGGSDVTARGVCWGTTQNPTISSGKTSDGSGNGTFTSNITGLTANTTYYVRAYATNSEGTGYGNEVSFTTKSNTLQDIDGNNYNTVQIGTQIWMKENLKTTRYKDGSTIPLVSDNTSWSNLTSPGYCWFKNDASTYGGTYGALYNWYSVSTGKLCPDSWHVPTDAEWTMLVTFLGGPNLAGGKMKEQGTSHWISPNVGATNESNFTGLPGAYRDEGGGFYETVGHYGFWWSSTELSSTNAWDRGLRYETNEIRTGEGYKKVGMSIRCLKN